MKAKLEDIALACGFILFGAMMLFVIVWTLISGSP